MDAQVEKKAKKPHNRRVHLANERTFLAWIRTSIALMAFGFVVEKFALFLKEAEYFLMRTVPGVPSSLPKKNTRPGIFIRLWNSTGGDGRGNRFPFVYPVQED